MFFCDLFPQLWPNSSLPSLHVLAALPSEETFYFLLDFVIQ